MYLVRYVNDSGWEGGELACASCFSAVGRERGAAICFPFLLFSSVVG